MKKTCGISKQRSCDCSNTINHLSRIEGQIKTLKIYIEEGKRCEDVALLTTSIAKSFDTLRIKTLKNFLMNDILDDKEISKKDIGKIDEILRLYKK